MIKKSFIVLAAVVLFIGIAFAEGELFAKPLEEFSLEELTEAQLKVNNEIIARFGKIEGVIIEPGLYIVGEDIPAGSYYFEGVQGRFSSSLHVYPSKDKMGSFDETQEIHGIGSDTPKTGRVILENGNAVQFVQGPVVLHIYKGLMD